MIPQQSDPPYTHGTVARVGLLLINLGTPEAPTPAALRLYLAEFLGDPRVVELPRALWLPLLHGIILNRRPRQSAAKYAQIWTAEGSPLRVHTERQAKLLQGYLGERTHGGVVVQYGMRYGQPSVAAGVEALRAQGCDRILMLPLYPQYASSTTASSQEALFAAVSSYRSQPAVRTVRHYHDHPAYIGALASSVRELWNAEGRPDRLVMSFHGVPRYTLDKGDPYHCECRKTGRLLGEALGLSETEYMVSFQSLFGRAEWLKPYTQPTLESLARSGVKRVDVICPGFPADCLETLEEIAMECKAAFMAAGGTAYRYIPCLNDRPDWIHALTEIALENLGGWIAPPPDAATLAASKARAMGMGASQ